MKIICLAKFIPDVDHFVYDYERNVLVRENMDLVLNPDDACALAYALALKKNRQDVEVEVLSMAPLSLLPNLKELLRLGADRGVLISDAFFSGSDTYATSCIIARYLADAQYDVILSGTHALDGDTEHVPVQVAELLGLDHMAYIVRFDDDSFLNGTCVFESEFDNANARFRVRLPCVLGVLAESRYKLPFVRYENLDLNVDDRVTVVTNEELGFSHEEVGIAGSLTKVASTWQPQMKKKEQVIVGNDDEGIETVFQFLKKEGYMP
ncbi:MAG: electron transfer flavoprotein subunit beta/FixA family protein [Clostridiales bacterium]|nr:electron transfer flavoprotein subunit beta/FixA family protein [Clostridiales bacterium]